MRQNVISERAPAYLNQDTRDRNDAMDFVSHREITLRLIDRSAIQLACVFEVYLFEPFHSMA